MHLKNPLVLAYPHPNFGGNTSKVSLNINHDVNAYAEINYETPNGTEGQAKLQFQDNGDVVIRVQQGGPIKVLVVDSEGNPVFEG